MGEGGVGGSGGLETEMEREREKWEGRRGRRGGEGLMSVLTESLRLIVEEVRVEGREEAT